MIATTQSENTSPILSIVSPVYRGGKLVETLVARISEEVSAITSEFEIILVEDGSVDESWAKIVAVGQGNPHVKGIKLSRNFGQHPAISAGIHHARGDYVVVIDCDLQDDPKYIRTLLDEARKGFDIVYTRKIKREHSWHKNIGAAIFNGAFNWLSENKQVYSNANVGAFSLLSRKTVEAFKRIKDYHRHYLLIVRWLGFPYTFVEIEHAKRFEGKSSYSLRRLLHHAIDGITSQSTRLLRVSIALGLLFCVTALLSAVALITLYFAHGFKEGWTSVMVLTLLSTGMILLSLGIVGLYLGKAFEQIKGRPLYIVESTVNMNPHEVVSV